MRRLTVAALAYAGVVTYAVAEPLVVRAIMCDSPSHVEQFAEALLGAGLLLDDAINAVNTAANARDACVFVPVLIEDIHDEKEITYADTTYVVRRVSVIALMRESRVGLISQRIEPRVQYSIAAKGTLPKRTLLRPRKRA